MARIRLFISSLLILPLFGITQEVNTKTEFKAGRDFVLEEKYNEGIEKLTKVIEADPEYLDAYTYRAKAYEMTGSLQLAIDDLNSYLIKSENNVKYTLYYDLCKFYNLVGDYEKAVDNASSAISLSRKYLPAYHEKVKAQVELKQYEGAFETSARAVEISDDKENFYYKGLSYYLLKEYLLSSGTFELALRKDPDYVDALIGKAKAFYEMDQANQALGTINHALEVDETCKECYIVRSKVNYKRVEYQDAVNDLSKVIVLYPNDPNKKEYFFNKGKYNAALNKYTDGIVDFTTVIALDKDYAPAYYERGLVHEVASQKAEAVEDFKTFLELASLSQTENQQTIDATNRIFNINKENDAPEIMIVRPNERIPGILDIINNLDNAEIIGSIVDASDIKKITVNGKEIEVNHDIYENIPFFKYDLKVKEATKVEIVVSDIYDNDAKFEYGIRLTEMDKPMVKIVEPYTSDNINISLDGTPTRIYVEGFINDESLIKSITIDSITDASFTKSDYNPSFYANFNIVNKTSFTLRVEDYFGNVTTNTYYINRGQLNEMDSPMGRSWAFFIENSDYETFEKLEGPQKDVNKMISLLDEKYNFTSVVRKKDFTKEDFERFFKMELRDLITEYRINSVFIWYAGHGSLNKGVGYWIPVDGRADDEYTHFSLNDMKSSLETYSQDLTHLLVISDACQAGGSLYEKTRASNSDKNCNDKMVIQSKSTQIVTSADSYGEALDQSQFMEVFYNTLKNNDLSCISIDKVYEEVKKVLEMGGSQTPQFSNIKGLKSENGTFFFVKKE
jgi:tetratricopeptide (TPR) repeat protein